MRHYYSVLLIRFITAANIHVPTPTTPSPDLSILTPTQPTFLYPSPPPTSIASSTTALVSTTIHPWAHRLSTSIVPHSSLSNTMPLSPHGAPHGPTVPPTVPSAPTAPQCPQPHSPTHSALSAHGAPQSHPQFSHPLQCPTAPPQPHSFPHSQFAGRRTMGGQASVAGQWAAAARRGDEYRLPAAPRGQTAGPPVNTRQGGQPDKQGALTLTQHQPVKGRSAACPISRCACQTTPTLVPPPQGHVTDSGLCPLLPSLPLGCIAM